jgi:hypothetical protein
MTRPVTTRRAAAGLRAWVGRACTVVGAGTIASACGGPGGSFDYVSIMAPDYAEFAGKPGDPGVHTFLEKRCGTLDCHGQTGRPFRLFSSGGLRLLNDAGLTSGTGADSPQEIYANYQALVGLQPEEISRVVSGKAPATGLLIVGKPLALQTHKGGQVLAPGDPGDVCLESWLIGQYSASACSDAASVP